MTLFTTKLIHVVLICSCRSVEIKADADKIQTTILIDNELVKECNITKEILHDYNYENAIEFTHTVTTFAWTHLHECIASFKVFVLCMCHCIVSPETIVLLFIPKTIILQPHRIVFNLYNIN